MPLRGAPSSFSQVITFVRDAAQPDSLPTGDSEIEEIQAYLAQLQLSARVYNTGPKDPKSAPRVNIFPNEIRFKHAVAASTYLTRVHAKQTATGNPPISDETDAELTEHIQQVGKLNDAMHSSFSRQGAANFFLLCVHPPLNYAAAVRDGWFVGFDGSEEERVELYETFQLWHHTLAVKVKGRTVSLPSLAERTWQSVPGVADALRVLNRCGSTTRHMTHMAHQSITATAARSGSLRSLGSR
jgi:hypothetical protein